MSPEDSTNPGLNTKPDFSSVPLPEPPQAQSPYAQPSGTLGEIAENVETDNATTSQQPSAIPTPGVIADDSNTASDAPASTQTSEVAPAGTKPKGKKLPLIIGIVVAVLLIIGAVAFFLIVKPFGGGSGGGGGISAGGDAFFASSNFFVSSDEKGTTTYAIYDTNGKAVTDFVYSATPNHFLANAALARKNGEYGLIDSDGKEIIPFGQYKTIKAYGALYGIEKDDKNVLVNNKGEEVVEYTDDNINHHSDYTSNKEVAYTVFRSGDHYTVYSPYGAKVAEFDSTLSPTITTPSFGESGAQSVIVYSGGIIVLDDKGGEVRKLERSIGKKLFGTFISKDSNLIGFSTVNELVTNLFGSISVPNDKRDNVLVIGESFYEFNKKDCAGLYYDETYAEGSEGGYVLCMKGYSGYPISFDGEVSTTSLTPSVAKDTPTSLYLTDSVYPISMNSYAMMTDGNSLKGTFGIFYNGKKVANFVSGNVSNDADAQKKTKTKTTIDYKLFGMADGYIVNRLETKTVSYYSDSALTTPTKSVNSASGKIIFYNKKGEEICTFDKDGYYGVAQRDNSISPDLKTVKDIDSHSVSGFVNGFAQVRKVDSDNFVTINSKCEIEDEKAAYAQTKKYGDIAVTIKKAGNGYKQELRDKQNKIIATLDSKYATPSVTSYTNNYQLFKGENKTLFTVGDKIAKEFNHFCTFNSGIVYSDRYVQLSTAGPSGLCDDQKAVGGEHYYFLPNGEQFYFWKEGASNAGQQ